MQRSFAALESTKFDVLVIGGGITGAGIARDAAMRGLKVAIVDKGDWGSGTSSRSSRLIHGGIRYLERGQVGLVRESVRERETLLRIAPHLVKPLEFTWPVYRGARLPKWKLRAGLTAYDMLAGVGRLRRHDSLDVQGVLTNEPDLRKDSLVGGVSYYDASTDDSRITLANVQSAVSHGAVAVNYARISGLTGPAASTGAIARDQLSDAELHVYARAVISATGPWQARGTKGTHIAVPRHRIANRSAVTLISPVDGRVMFVIPSGDQAIVGTTDTFTIENPDQVRASEADIDYLLASANGYFPDARLTRDDVVAAWAGIRPLAAAKAGTNPSSISREHHIERTGKGRIAVSGGKLTTYRAMAAEAVDCLFDELGMKSPACRTADEEVPGRDRNERRATIEAADPRLARSIVQGLPYTGSDIALAALDEMAVTLADVMVRRTHIAFELSDHGLSAARSVATVMGEALRWGDKRTQSRIDEYPAEVERLFGRSAIGRLSGRWHHVS
ncbi:MAG TPA: glycerol-3-phosphate dehydrogenase/oxidase [Gemmatimonadaceae bacterium]|nr:glycerol-3-phosphate dehydrogenase/oxidase [Gemmatimonadaceae bacterium]